MATECGTRDQYIDAIASTLYSLLCLRDFPCQDVERRSKPEIEFGSSKELLLDPKIVRLKGFREECLMEPSINSTRISFLFNRGDNLEMSIAQTFHKFLGMKADHLDLLRRTPVHSYDVSFLVTSELLQLHGPMSIVLSILKFAVEVPEFLVELKASVVRRQQENVRAYFCNH
eukprot:jgi/Ulvmu1/7291/UM035_0079.1